MGSAVTPGLLTGSSFPQQPKRAIIYVRVSRYRDKDEKISPELQIDACNTLAEREGMVVIDVLQDLNLSGKYFAKRQVEQIIQRIKRGEADVVLVWRWSRFGRDATLSSYNIKRLEQAGGEIRAAKEDIDTSSSGGRLGRNTHLIVAEYEVDRSRESWMETHDHRRNRGVTHDGQLRFGYGKCRRPLEGDPDSRCEKCRVGALHVEESEAAYVREMFERLSAGEPMNRIVVDMTARGLRTREGAVLTIGKWYRMLDSGYQAGYVRHQPTKYRKELGSSHVDAPGIEWIKGIHDPLVPEDLWTAYKARRGSKSGSSRDNAPAHSVTGLIYCDLCGWRMVSGSTKYKRKNGDSGISVFFRCSAKVRGATCTGGTVLLTVVEEAVRSFLASRVTQEGDTIAAASARETAATPVARPVEVDQYAQLNERNAELERLVTLYTKGMIKLESYEHRYRELTDAIAKLEAQIEQRESVPVPAVAPSPQVFRGILTEWEGLEAWAKRQALSMVVHRIAVRPGPRGTKDKVRIIPVEDAERYSPQAALPAPGRAFGGPAVARVDDEPLEELSDAP
ncbi:recombinase family protein [Streptomyces sp. NPDC090231]|uniref:recombinase family protein n=1 Tax=unclassified Streptomyces TaxID=2593676 RepID=UPI00382EE2A4